MIVEIYDLLFRLGVTPNYADFFHTSYAVLLSAQNMERLLLASEWLYPEVAKHYRTTPRCVERNIRSATATAWSRNPELLAQIARCQLADKPTASQFISILASVFTDPQIPA